MQKKSIKVKDIISLIFIIVLIIFGVIFYKKYNFNEFIKAEHIAHTSKFERDSSVKATDYSSYKISSSDYNDAMFYKTVNVIPNTSYKVTCKIKTENVENEKINTDAGAHICISDTFEKSEGVTGTSDWTDATFCFNSKNRTEVNIGFRLGRSRR